MRNRRDRVSSIRSAKQWREHLLQSSSQDIGLFHAFKQHGVLLTEKFVFVFKVFKIATLKIWRVRPRLFANGRVVSRCLGLACLQRTYSRVRSRLFASMRLADINDLSNMSSYRCRRDEIALAIGCFGLL